MAGHVGNYEFWDVKRRATVRALLRRGDDRRLIAERMGVTLHTLSTAIHRLNLLDDEAA